MKNILAKIVLGFVIVSVFVIGLKVSNDILAKANASTNDTNSCGINNGWIWNGNSCVNTCDPYHPWDGYQRKCSNGFGYSNSQNYNSQNANCGIYGMNFYFDGKNCVQIQTGVNANYYGNPYNGGTQSPVYGNINYQNLVYQSNNYNIYNNVVNTNVIPNNSTYYNYNPVNTCDYYCNSNPWNENFGGAKTTYYYIYTITTTTSQPAGIPLYYGNNYSPWYNSYNSNYQNNNQYYSYSYNYNGNYNNGYYY